MKIKVRAKAGGGLTVTDENGLPLDGLEWAVMSSCAPGQVPTIYIAVRGPEVAIDADAVFHPAHEPPPVDVPLGTSANLAQAATA